MSARRINCLLRKPGLGVLVALILLVAGVLSLSGVHPSHKSFFTYHHDGSPHQQPLKGQHSESSCAICFFHSSTATADFSASLLPHREMVAVTISLIPSDHISSSAIVTLWSGRAPPLSSVS